MNAMQLAPLLAMTALVFFPVTAQTPSSDAALLAKSRALYDAPFTQELISFDCSVHLDWKQHLMDALHRINPDQGMTPQAISVAERLQTVAHTVFVDRSGAVVSASPSAPDFSGIAHADQLEQVFRVIVKEGLNVWIPAAKNVILPIAPTKYSFAKTEIGYKVDMSGDNFSASLDLNPGLGIVSGSALRPQAYQFKTEFETGPDGYLLRSLSTSSSAGGWATFDYTYQTIQGIQLPLQVTVKPATSEPWRYTLSECKVMKGIVVKGLPKR